MTRDLASQKYRVKNVINFMVVKNAVKTYVLVFDEF